MVQKRSEILPIVLLHGKSRFPIQKHGRLCYLCSKVGCENVNKDSSVYKSSSSSVLGPIKSVSLNEWHKILGHCNTSDVLKLENIVHGNEN